MESAEVVCDKEKYSKVIAIIQRFAFSLDSVYVSLGEHLSDEREAYPLTSKLLIKRIVIGVVLNVHIIIKDTATSPFYVTFLSE